MTASISAAEYRRRKAKKPSKYKNVPTTIGGERFASKREGLRYLVLKQMAKNGEISSLDRQVAFILAPSVRIAGEKRARPAMKYTADFSYRDTKTRLWVVEDAKGHADTAFRLRQHLMKSVHNIDVRLS